VGGYLTKLAEDEGPGRTPGLQLARVDLKTGRSWGSRTPFRILADHERARKPADWRLFEEWLHVSKGRRTLEWSRGLRARLLPDEQERPDEELAEEAEPAEEIAVLEVEVWSEVVRRGRNVGVLATVEAPALAGLVVLLRAVGLDVRGWRWTGAACHPMTPIGRQAMTEGLHDLDPVQRGELALQLIEVRDEAIIRLAAELDDLRAASAAQPENA
jgi:hypothetical protein